MRVTVVGAGPAGLYLAILLRKADSDHEITVVERNAPDATFGWGVVFSEGTLGALRDADPRTAVEIDDTFARWDTVDIRYQGRLLRSRGHSFSAISRKLLLDILQRRCRELGVELRFGVEVDDPARVAEMAATTDLLVGADGVHSVVRRAHADAFGSSVEPQGCKYVWFGTDLVLDAFTFIFRETEHGLFQVHSYPFDERTSTFIVECPERTWRSAGLDRMSEQESIAFCEKLFAADLDGHRLLSNRSLWTSFLRVRNRSWHHDNVVLLGDAAHTAHFSIGSGTKLAMEDAVALAGAFLRHDDVGAALVDYELQRQPVVERFQQAAAESAGYFSRVEHHTDLAPLQFAFNLLTRSGRISHANLEARDPDFMRVLDAWFARDAARASGNAREAGEPVAIAPPPLFAPLRLGSVTVRNRVARTVAVLSTEDGGPEAGTARALADVAAGGAGLVLVGPVAVTLAGRTSPRSPTLHTDAHVDAWRHAVGAAHERGALVGLLLGHAGRRGSTRPPEHGLDIPLDEGGWPLVAASALPYGPFHPVPRAATEDDLAELRGAFADAAERAARAGFDLLELDLAHGHLLAGFLSPLTNRRDDDYGGPLENRLRFPLDVVRAVRDRWPGERPLAVRLGVTDWARGGLTVDEGVRAAASLVAGGVGLVHVEAGQTVPHDDPPYGRGFLTTLSDRVRSEARVPTLVGGHLTTPDEINTVVGAGRSDLCLLDLADSPLDRELVAAGSAPPVPSVPQASSVSQASSVPSAPQAPPVSSAAEASSAAEVSSEVG
ncbi:anthraniloyl-CoA monooxygenase [Streptoalloteichus tenebrarius]|uniref:Anthraniloyl-CoA monooxygenase n=1 Tax=Streptoalloteichus tenebrarius (strain ATCC 17920 / DSM 40477 / JCM 4838 / CBS 697.72 / NBRC 16177 / NCIMB 11028 / NRRL B-12390 / A12253. 1 / ISP 5477) TaxID=1933 RepID=A0ABT1HZB0_STRSD|nr:FAD-dependent monooxygenase [Streptoalloteichus tenebrarius]MCP2260690.1 anthraniloyl-CoA monooxygenase [Streptoalloteichus tenebrarius]BFF03777.1 bifunctional salicylyl-CoA 5-hydroxylase/oxidoreductase [Streptoalloteichus tenebrarius]